MAEENKTSKSFDALRNKILGKTSVQNIDKIDQILSKISSSITDKDSVNKADFLKKYFSDTINNKMFDNMSANIILSTDVYDRLIRYSNAEEICDSLSYCARALKVIADEVVSPDDVKKTIIQFVELDKLEEEQKRVFSKLKTIKNTLNIEDYLPDIVYETLKLGDQFVEICDYTKDDVPLTQSLLFEDASIVSDDIKNQPLTLDYTVEYDEIAKEKNGEIKENTFIQKSKKVQIEITEEGDADKNSHDITNVRLILHDPRYVIKLQSKKFRMCLGYLVLPRATGSDRSSSYGSCGGMGGGGTKMRSVTSNLPMSGLYTNQPDMFGVDRIYADVMGVIKKQFNRNDIDVNKKEFKDMMERVIQEFDAEYTGRLRLRYVPSERMEHFKINNRRFFPYGEGIFFKSTFAAKLLMAFEIALVIKRISDSSDKRIIGVETGLPRNVKSLIEEIKNSLKKRKFSVDTIGNVSAIPCLHLDTKIKLTNGLSLPLKEIIKQHEAGNKMEIYAYDHETGKIVPDEIVNARITGKDVDAIKVTLDNDEYIICTPDHLWMLDTGYYIEAQNLQKDTKIMSQENISITIKDIEKLAEKITVGDIETKNFHNFATQVGVFIHNSMITSYEDYYIPQNKGKRYVEFDTLQATVSLRDISDELKLYRDFLISGLEVPPSYLSLEENLCISLNSLIKLVDGRSITLEKLIEEHQSGIAHEVYSYDLDRGVIFPNKIIWAGKTRMNTECVRVWLDNGEYIDCTPDHPFMLRTGEYIEARNLKNNDSLMPIYQKDSTIYRTNRDYYTEVYHPGINEWQLEHQSFAIYCNICNNISREMPIHHINHNPRDNRSCNLISISAEEHCAIHSRTKKYTDDQLNSLIEDRKKLITLSEPGVIITYIDQICKVCNKLFKRRTIDNIVTCSSECRSKYHAQTGLLSWESRKSKRELNGEVIKTKCGWCGKEIELFKNAEYDENKVYSCGDKNCSLKLKGYNTSVSKFKGITKYDIEYKICDICQNQFIYSPQDKSKVLTNVCRKTKCINTILSRRGAEKKKAEKRIELTCEFCGDSFWRHKTYVNSIKNNPSCGSPECYSKNISKINNERVLNHKVVKVEILEGTYDTGDITVEKYHNFAVASGVFVHNSNKSALSYENMLFARTIISYQTILSKDLRGLFSKIFRFIYGTPMDLNIKITFNPPRMLQMAQEAEQMDMVGRVIDAMANLGVDKEYLKHKYLNIDWDELKKFESESNIKKNTDSQQPDDAMGGMGGMDPSMGAGGGGMY